MPPPRIRAFLLLTLLPPCLAAVRAEPSALRPNILWITGEDMNAKWLACYGNEQIQTPNFDKLAREGFLYTNCYAHTPVCAPARSGWITGIHPVSTGTIYMRSLYPTPTSLVWYPDALRANDYFAGNYTKTDYNTSNRKEGGFGGGPNEGSVGHYINTWDSYEESWWNNPKRRPDQPFFQVINSAGVHESYLHNDKNTHQDVQPSDMRLAAYHPDIPEIRMDYARYTAGVMAADKALGRILEKLQNDGHADDTIVIYNSDHGGVIGRSKRFLYDSGTHAAFIMRIPEKFRHLWPAPAPGARIDRLVSFLDLPKTWLAITGSSTPAEMQGSVLLGPQQEAPREYVFIARERMDEAPDMQRAVRDQRYLYIRSYEPFRPDGQYLEYLWKAPSMQAWEGYHKAGKTDATTGAFFRPKPVEQLFDCENDPDNVRNLAGDPASAGKLDRMRSVLREQQTRHHDCGFLPEGILMHRVTANKTTTYDFIRNPGLYDQQGYMNAADLANFAKPADLPKLVELLHSPDAGYRYWGVLGCIKLGKQAATPEVLRIVEDLITTDVKDQGTLDVRATAALYLAQIDHTKDAALRALAEIISDAPGKSPGRGRAWANVFLLGSEAGAIVDQFTTLKLGQQDQAILRTFIARLK